MTSIKSFTSVARRALLTGAIAVAATVSFASAAIAAPDTTITQEPGEWSTIQYPTFAFTSDTPGSTFECLIVNYTSWFSCSSPYNSTSYGDGGPYEFQVRATAGGQTDATPAGAGFSVDTTAPYVNITAPGAVTNDTTPAVTYQFTDSGSGAYSTECKVDGGSYATCTQSLSTQTYGTHTLYVRGYDVAGNASTDTQVFSVEPDTQITDGPPEGDWTIDTSPEFSFTSDAAGATFECMVVSYTTFAACTSPTGGNTSYGTGTYTFKVRAVKDGVVDSTPHEYVFKIDDTLPNANITAPTGTTSDTTPLVTYTASDSHSGLYSVTCQVDSGSQFGCTSGYTSLPTLANGQHTLTLRATDVVGNVRTDVENFTVHP